MRCSYCGKNEAPFRVEQSVGGEQRLHWMCVECAQMAGIMTELPPRMPRPADLFEELLFGREDGSVTERRCGNCGTTYHEFRASGRVGCPECYTMFHHDIAELAEREKRPHAYNGSLPDRIEPYRTFYVDREALRQRLQHALDEERYEEAAHLRDRIRIMDGRGEE
ncbi:MAG: hypothetical protein EA384_10705 [Spirochaetaceae bacterium]|nr:MAG: hypothetical protein EA384_10705 [Spirochaetaceae bacterium]